MEMTVSELIKKLQECNPDAKVVTITVGNRNEWEYTSNPVLKSNKNSFGERVFIQ
jgi:hypothetical protein